MIAISKAEKEAIVAQYPDVHIVRTMVNDSRRHHYYMTEDKKPLKLLRRLRETGCYYTAKGSGNNRAKKNRK